MDLRKPFKIGGHEVFFTSPVTASLVIKVPWEKCHEPTPNEVQDVVNITNKILFYMENEGIILGRGIGLTVYTQSENI